jgi:MYXO-CTERM domain-containing protein
MSPRIARHLAPAVLAFVALGLAAGAAHAGPPWISVELPANPHDARTRGALLVVHTYHHGGSMEQSITCALEGLVDGRRRTIACRAEATSRAGVYAVRGDVPKDGIWMLVVTGRDGESPATALVDFGREGQVTGVRVPIREAEGGRWHIPVPVTEAEIGAALRTRWNALSSADEPSRSGTVAAGAGLALLVGLTLVRRRRA